MDDDDAKIGHAMRLFRRAIQQGSITECTRVTHDTSSLVLVYNARTLPNHRCWETPDRVLMLTPQWAPQLQLYGCLDCGRTHWCRSRATADDDDSRDEASDLCPGRVTDESCYVCAFSARVLTDAAVYATYGSYTDWLDKQELSYDDVDDDNGGAAMADDRAAASDDDDDADAEALLRLHLMRTDTKRAYERSQFATNTGRDRAVAQTAKTAAMRLSRGLRQAQVIERNMEDSRRFTRENLSAYRAMHGSDDDGEDDDDDVDDGDLWFDDDDDDAEKEADAASSNHRRRRILLVGHAADGDANRGTYTVMRSRPTQRDYNYWNRYHFVGDRSLQCLFDCGGGGEDWRRHAHNIFGQRRAAPSGAQPALVRFRRQYVRANRPPRLLRWLKTFQHMSRARRLTLNDELADRAPPVPLSWMTRVDSLLAELWPQQHHSVRVDYIDFLARWIRLGWLARSRATPDATIDDLVERRYPAHLVLVAFLLYLGRTELRLKDGAGFDRMIRAYDERVVAYFATQHLVRRIFGTRGGGGLAEVEAERALAKKLNSQRRKRRKAARGIDTYSATAQAVQFAPSTRLTAGQLLAAAAPPADEDDDEEEEKDDEPRRDDNKFHCTLNQIHRMRDRLMRMLGVGDRSREFTATFFVQWFHDPAFQCWHGQPLLLHH